MRPPILTVRLVLYAVFALAFAGCGKVLVHALSTLPWWRHRDIAGWLRG